MSDSEEQKAPKLNIQPDVMEELRETESEDMIVEYGSVGGDSSEKTQFTEKYFPESHEWQGKTNITERQAHALAFLRHIDGFFDEIPPAFANFLRDAIDDYEMLLTSVDGEARKEYADILKAMHGVDTEAEETRSLIDRVAAGKMGEDDD